MESEDTRIFPAGQASKGVMAWALRAAQTEERGLVLSSAWIASTDSSALDFWGVCDFFEALVKKITEADARAKTRKVKTYLLGLGRELDIGLILAKTPSSSRGCPSFQRTVLYKNCSFKISSDRACSKRS